MKILWIPQISSKGSDNLIYLSKDSNMSALYNLLDSDFGKNEIDVYFEYDVFSENSNVIIDEVVFDRIRKNGIIYDNKNRKYTNAKLERFDIDVNSFITLKKLSEENERKYDIIFVNEPTKVEALKAIFINSFVVTYNHWLACKNMKDIELRQYEGMCNADICYVNSKYAKNQIKEYYRKWKRKPNIKVSNPTFIEDVSDVKLLSHSKWLGIIYNHRLSSDPYYLNAYKSLLNVMKMVHKELQFRPTVYFTNPTNKDFVLDDKHMKPKEINLINKKDYFNFLRSNEINIHLNTFFDSEGMWCQSTIDSAITGNICLLPNKYGYAEMFDKKYFGYCKNEKEMAKKIISLFTNPDNVIKYNYKDLEKRNSKTIGDQLNKELRDLIESRKE